MPSAKSFQRLSIQANQSSPEAVRGFLRECLVPLLAKQFLIARNAPAHVASTAETNNSTSGLLSREDGRRADHTHVK
jgi:hypothetical protein